MKMSWVSSRTSKADTQRQGRLSAVMSKMHDVLDIFKSNLQGSESSVGEIPKYNTSEYVWEDSCERVRTDNDSLTVTISDSSENHNWEV